ncbi:MAG: cytochrome P450 [Myxococcota bacterium]
MVVYDPYDWKVHEDPYPVYRALRDEAPAYFNQERNFWALSRYQDVLEAFRDPVTYSNKHGVSIDEVGDASQVMSFLGMDPPEHGRIRTLVSRGFTPRRVSELESGIRDLATYYIDTFIEAGGCDFIDDFAGKLPMDVISQMLGVPAEDRDCLRTWADLVLHREEGSQEVPPQGRAAAAQLIGYFAKHLDERRRRPGDDNLTDALILAEVEGDRLADRDIIAFLFLMVVAGNETTTKLLGNALYWIERNPEERALLDANPPLVAGWAEETLRYDPSSQLIARTTTCDVEIHDCKIPEGSRVALLIGAANRDERVFGEPDTFAIERSTSQSLAFGQGTHFCLGASLARLEALVSLEEIHRRIGNFEIQADGLVRVHSSNVRGFAKMPIAFPTGAREGDSR